MITVNFIIDAGESCSVSAKAYSKDRAGIFISAPDMQAAQALVEKGEQMARAALEEWEPVKEETAEEHYLLPPITQEQAGRKLTDFEQTPAGSRMIKAVENAAAFTAKKDKKGLLIGQVLYFSLVAYKAGIYDAITQLYMYAFRRGYKRAKREA